MCACVRARVCVCVFFCFVVVVVVLGGEMFDDTFLLFQLGYEVYAPRAHFKIYLKKRSETPLLFILCFSELRAGRF